MPGNLGTAGGAVTRRSITQWSSSRITHESHWSSRGGTTFTFVTGGIDAALDQARRAAGGKDVSLAGGAKACQQYLTAGLVDEMEISLVPMLLGRGELLFDGVGTDLRGLQLVRTVATPQVTHLKFARR